MFRYRQYSILSLVLTSNAICFALQSNRVLQYNGLAFAHSEICNAMLLVEIQYVHLFNSSNAIRLNRYS